MDNRMDLDSKIMGKKLDNFQISKHFRLQQYKCGVHIWSCFHHQDFHLKCHSTSWYRLSVLLQYHLRCSCCNHRWYHSRRRFLQWSIQWLGNPKIRNRHHHMGFHIRRVLGRVHSFQISTSFHNQLSISGLHRPWGHHQQDSHNDQVTFRRDRRVIMVSHRWLRRCFHRLNRFIRRLLDIIISQ